MAIFHKGLTYHEDTVPKKPLTKEDIYFLQNLQKEMNTQDTVSQADPRFWTIAQTERQYHVNDDADGWVLYDVTNNQDIAHTIPELYEWLRDTCIPEINQDLVIDDPENRYEIECKDDNIIIKNPSSLCEYTTLDEIQDFLNTLCFQEYEIIYYRDLKNQIVKDTMFLTQKSAERHLKNNAYNYHADAHTYAMTAYRSPEVSRLYKILQETDWSKLLNETGIINPIIEPNTKHRVYVCPDQIENLTSKYDPMISRKSLYINRKTVELHNDLLQELIDSEYTPITVKINDEPFEIKPVIEQKTEVPKIKDVQYFAISYKNSDYIMDSLVEIAAHILDLKN